MNSRESNNLDKRLKLLMLTTSFPLSNDSVSGVFIKRLVDHLAETADIRLLTPCPDFIIQPLPLPYSVSCFRYAPIRYQVLAHKFGGLPVAIKSVINWPFLPVFLLSMFLACTRKGRKVDLIHANWSINGFVAGLAAKFIGKPLITSLRGSDIERAKSSVIDRWILRRCLSMSNAVVAVSASLRDTVLEISPGSSKKIFIVENGVGDEFLEIEHKKSGSEKVFVVVGNLIPVKGIELAINAFSNEEISRHSKMLIAGDGPERNRLEALTVKLGLQEKVCFLGKIAPEKIKDLYKNADIFIHPSRSEGRPNVLLEAMASGLAVIGSDIPGIVEVVDDGVNGLLFKCGDADSLSDKMKLLLNDEVYSKKMADSGRRYILSHGLTWGKAAQAYKSIYESVLMK